MTDSANDNDFVDFAAHLLTYYSFDLAGATIDQLIEGWIQRYPPHWLMAAVVEALYQGRYKAVSVGQILTIWSRRGQPISHYNSEFERMVCDPILLRIHPSSSATSPQSEADSQADTASSQVAPAPSGHPHSIEPSTLESQLLPQSDVLSDPNQTGLRQTGSEQKGLGQIVAGQMGTGNSTIGGDLDIDEAITPHFEKAERFLHPDQPIPYPPDQPSKSSSNPPPAKRVGQANGGHPEHANRDWEQSFTGYPADVRGASNFQASADDRLHLREGLPPESIHKFVPPPEASNFYSRLQAMASRQQAPASLSQHEPSGDENAASPLEPHGSSNGSSDAMKGAMKGDSPQDSSDEFHSHLENIHLPPQPDLEAIAESLYQESLQEEALKRELSAVQFQSSNEINTRSEADEQ